MSALSRGVPAALLALGLALPGCALISIDPTPGDTVFRVYDLDDLYRGGLDPGQTRTFESMVRDAVGEDEWYATQSTFYSLGPVLTIRTTTDGHERLVQFFGQFRSISEGASPAGGVATAALDR